MTTRYSQILERIKKAVETRGEGPEVHLIAVSKKQSAEAVEVLYRLGHRDFGENYAQELVAKAQELERRGCTGIRWHFIGHLQSNKIKMILPYVSVVHTVDSEKLAAKLADAQADRGPLPIFLEVNIDHEEGKGGVSPEAVAGLASTVSKSSALQLQGLMCIPAAEGNSKEAFRKLNALEKTLRPSSQGMLSMGMSSDFEMAIQEGATHVRVGTALFGERTKA